MRRLAPVWLLTIILAVATGTVISSLVAVLTAPLPNAASVDRGSAVVWAFYDAVNHVLHTGETAPLDALLAADMVEHDPAPGLPQSGSGLIRRLGGLHATHPGMTLVVEEVFASGDVATARVHVEGSAQGVFLGLTVGEDRPAWGPLDQFRVVDGRIVEHWGGAATPTLLELLQHTSGAGWFVPGELVALERRTVPVSSPPASQNADGVRLIFMESGSLTVAIDPTSTGPALLSAAVGIGTAGPPEQIAPGEQRIVGPGDLLALPTATGHTIVNTARVTAEAVVIASSPDPTYAPYYAARTPSVDPNGMELSSGRVAVALGSATLAPGGTLRLTEATGQTVVTVESGTLEIQIAGGTARLRHSGIGPHTVVVSSSFLDAGDEVLVRPSIAISFRNLGTTPADLLLGTILPDESPT